MDIIGITYPAMAVLVSKSLEAYETTDVTKANFFALMFFVVALGNLVLYATTGWLSNVVAQVGHHTLLSEFNGRAAR